MSDLAARRKLIEAGRANLPIRISERIAQQDTCDEVVLIRRDGGEFGTVFDYINIDGPEPRPVTRNAEWIVQALADYEPLLHVVSVSERLLDLLTEFPDQPQAWAEGADLLGAALARLPELQEPQ